MSTKIKEWISTMPEYIPGRTIEEIKKEYGLKEVFKLASNENLFGPHPDVIKKICENLGDIKYYPDAECREIRKKLAGKYDIDSGSIIMGNGTDQIIEMICDSFIEPGDNAVIADPTFLIYEKSTLKCSGTVIKVPLKEFRQDVEKVDTIDYLSRYSNLVVLRTFSKIYGLAGLRIGYGISGNSIISALNKIRLPFNVNSIAQKAAAAALENESYVEEIRAKIEEEK